MSACNNQDPVCPCGGFVHPSAILNAAGLDNISYRVGDYTTFRHALLRALPGEVSLTSGVAQDTDESISSPPSSNITQIWRPGATGDLAVQMIEWWAYLADILTFYNERIATQAYLRTADQSITVNRLVRLLGCRPKPGIGATGTLAALMNAPTAFTLPRGFQFQSKPGPGQAPQIFELLADTVVQGPDVLAVEPSDNSGPVSAEGSSVLVAGVVKSVKPGDSLLLLESGWAAADSNYAFASVKATSLEKDPLGKTNTRVTFSDSIPASIAGAKMSGYVLLATNSVANLYQYLDSTSPFKAIGLAVGSTTSGYVELGSIFREIHAGDTIVLQDLTPGTKNQPLPAIVTGYQEKVYYANNKSDPTNPPPTPNPTPPPAPPGIPIPHTFLTYSINGSWFSDATNVVVRYGWKSVGTLLSAPVVSVGAGNPDLQPAGGSPLSDSEVGAKVLIEDALGNGDFGQVDTTTSISLATPVPDLKVPLKGLFNLLPVTRGKTVTREVLGSGNAGIAGQDFVLQKSPVTYLQDPAAQSGDNYSSTVRVWVNEIEWTEVQSFYNRASDEQIFITKEDEQGQTHVVFGDGMNGARPSSGTNNIVATYRYGSGSAAPAAGSLTVILKPQPGLKAVRNPVQVGGGGDPDPPDLIRQYAPRSVLTFGRAVSMEDFEAIAAAAPGVTRAQAVYGVNPLSQRPQIQVYVVPEAALKNARSAIAGAADPNRYPVVIPAQPVYVTIQATLVIAPLYQPADVLADATSALAGKMAGLFVLDPNSGLPAIYIRGIGQPVYDSQIYSALQVPGVKAVTGFSFSFGPAISGPMTVCGLQRHDPKAGNYLALASTNLQLATMPPIPAP